MFEKILIANRGEIACRIMRTCRRMGIATVAVYSEADRDALHAVTADQAVAIGAAPAAQSYLNIAAILEAAQTSGAQAIHPGYGFLSENPDFARQVSAAGLVFIGPSPHTMELMASKARAKAIMSEAAVPLVPGYHDDDQDDETLAQAAAAIGYPLMLKAAAGGGGKGMRIVTHADGFLESLQAARREARNAFGDERMILERYLERPRHIEVQVFGDSAGNIVHLYERDCSSQRRHQKVIEEAPAPNLSDALRNHLFDAALAAARKVDYVGAGTVEFLVAGDDGYFLEMNTRLQVEHPVTEQVTGLDLVEWQLRVAAGQPLPLKQDEIRLRGHAMEARIYAEDPTRNFMPSSGRITTLTLPETRVDSGVREGDSVSIHYDPMIAKIITHGTDRAACLAAMRTALAASFITGPATNLAFLQRLCAHPVFIQGHFDTGLLDREPDRFTASSPPAPEIRAAVIAISLAAQERQVQQQAERAQATGNPWFACDGWRLGQPASRTLTFQHDQETITIEATGRSDHFHFCAGEVRATLATQPAIVIDFDTRAHHLYAHTADDRIDICDQQQRWIFTRQNRFETSRAESTGSGQVTAPMPGRLLELRVAAGDEVAAGQTVAVMEAMKMELAIKAPRSGKVSRVNVSAEDLVEADTLLLEIAE